MYDEKPPPDCHALLDEGWVYLDVRTPDEFDGAHPTGAMNIPFALIGPGGMMPNPAFLSFVRATFPTDTRMVVGGASGRRSSRACQMLAQMGYGQLVHCRGGFTGSQDATGAVEERGWADFELPVVRGRDEGSYDQVRSRLSS